MDECTWDNLEPNTLVIDFEDPEEMYAAEDEHCGYTITSSGEDGYIECMSGLVCQAVEDPTATDSYGYTTICVSDTTDYSEGSDGVWDGGENDVTGFWTNTHSEGGTWVSGDGTMRGDWTYDAGSVDSGTWTFEHGSFVGTWVRDDVDDSIKHDTTPHSDQQCYDSDTESTTGTLLDRNDNSCEFYHRIPEECGLFDTDTFIAADLCCSCHGGETVSKGEVGDNCQDWDEMTSRYAPDCKNGLLCLYEE